MTNEENRELLTQMNDTERLALALERDARRYDKAYTEEEEVRLR